MPSVGHGGCAIPPQDAQTLPASILLIARGIAVLIDRKSLFLVTAALASAGFSGAVGAKSGDQARGDGGDTIAVTTRLGQRILRHGVSQRVFLRIGVRGIRRESDEQRTPANISLVIDRSGSMRGQKIQKARDAAKMAINRLGARDIASIVAFDDKVNTLARAIRVTDPSNFHHRIDDIRVGGSTAIYAAINEAARQIRRNKSSRRLNRIILISDGKANVGPSKPHHFEELGRRLGRDGISVTTIGLGNGYNEDLMSELARTSDGNHAFARTASDLTKIFNQEFDDVLSVTGQDIEIIIRTKAGVTPLRTLGRPGDIDGNEVRIRLNQVYGTAEYSLQLELDVPSGMPIGNSELVDVEVNYTPSKGERRRIEKTVAGRFSPSEEEARASIDPKVMEPILELEARHRSRQAIKLRDEGKIKEARKALRANAAELEQGQRRYRLKSKRLQKLQANSAKAAASIDDRAKWNTSRKQMREDQSNRQGAAVKY
ncbi:MAG: Ca-activated chloride channel family protein [Hyphomicrobiaceae bacterium]|jgi:Ca-activated chloride channel family protein